MKNIAEKNTIVPIIIKASAKIQTGFASILYVLRLAAFLSSAAAQDISPGQKGVYKIYC